MRSLIQRIAGLLCAGGVFGGIVTGLAQTNLAVTVRHAPQLGGRLEGSIQQMTGESVTLNGGAEVTGDLLAPGVPTLRLNGNPAFGGTITGAGATSPSNYQVTLNGSSSLSHLRTRIDPVTLETVTAPPASSGTRSVTLNQPGDPTGSFSTIKDLSLNGNVGLVSVPAGTYRNFTANANAGFILGVAGGTTPVAYNFQNLILNGNSELRVVGPVLVTLANGIWINGQAGASNNPAWLQLKVANGGVTLNGGSKLYALVTATTANSGTVIVNGNSLLVGSLACDRLTLNGNGVIRAGGAVGGGQAPTANAQTLGTLEDQSVNVTLTGADPEGASLAFTVLASPGHGSLTGTVPNLVYTPAANFFGTDSFTFKVNDGQVDSAPATITIDVAALNDRPTFSAGSNQTALEDAGAQTVTGWATSIAAGPANEASQTLVFLVTNNNNGLFANQPAIAPDGTLTYRPTADANGTATVTVIAQDNGGTASGGLDSSVASSFSITVTPVNDAPGFASGPDQVVEQNSGAHTVSGWATSISAGPANEAGQTVDFLVTSDNPSLFAAGPAISAAGVLTFTPAGNAYGVANVTVRIHDDGGTSNGGVNTSAAQVFTITVNQILAPPTANAQDVSAVEDVAQAIVLTGSSPGGGTLTYTVLTQPTNGTLTGSAPNLTYTPGTNYNGADSFTFKVNDGVSDSATATVSLTIQAVNDAPAFAKGANQTVAEDAGSQTVPGWATTITTGPANEAAQAVDFQVSSDNPALFSVPPAIAANGALTYTPATNANGAATVTARLHDNGGTANGGNDTSASQSFTITITPVNDLAVFTKGADQTVLEDAGLQTVTGWATAISSGPTDESAQTVDFLVTTDNAALFATAPVIAPDGTLTYLTATNANGVATVTVRVHDDGGGTDTSDPQTFVITVNAVNDSPVANAQTVSTTEDAPLAITLTGSDIEGSTLVFTVLIAPTNGVLSGSAPNLTYTPATNATGSDVFTFQVNDGQLDSAPATIIINVTPVNDAPVAYDQTLTTREDTALSITLAGSDVEGASLTYTIVTPPAHGVLSGSNPSPTYQPDSDFFGADSFTFKVNDGQLDSALATISISVSAVNDAPAFTAGGNETVMEDSGTRSVTGWATAISAGPANEAGQSVNFLVIADNTALFATQPAVSPVGTLTFTPAANANGAATVTVRPHDDGGVADGGLDTSAAQSFTITVTAVNDAPSFVKGADQTLAEDAGLQTVTGWATAINAGPADEATQAIDFVATTDNAALFTAGPAVSANGTLTYTPATNANGTATVTVRAHDDGGTANGGANTSAAQTFTITVTPVNDPPFVSQISDATVNEDGTVGPVAFTMDDLDSPLASLTIATNSSNLVLVPLANIAVGGTDTNRTVTVTPAPNASGTATISITVSDGTASTTMSFVITVNAVNDAPVAVAQSLTTTEDTALPITLTGSDVEGATLAYTIVTSPTNGVLTGTAPNLTYTPNTNFFGADTITFKVSDGELDSSLAIVTISVTPVNDVPVFVKGLDQSILEDAGRQTVSGWATAIVTGATNEVGQTLDFLVTTDNGALFVTPPAISSDGILTYTTAANANGSATVTVRLHDDGGTANGGVDTSAAQNFTITVAPVNDAPAFVKGTDQTVAEDAGAQTVTGWATGITAGPVNEAAQTVDFVVTTDNADLFAAGPTVSASGTLTYTPAANASGIATVTVRAHDNGGTTNGGVDTSAAQTFTITVNAVNDAPVAVAQSLTTTEDTALAIALTGSDVEGATLTFTIVNSPTNGVLSGTAPSLTYTPNTNFFGTDTFTFKVNDGELDSAPAAVAITVTSVNDAPVVTVSGNQTITLPANAVLTGSVADDTTPNAGLTFAWTKVSGPGTATFSSANSPNTTATFGAAGAYVLLLSASDGALTGVATVTITVNPPVNQAPVVNAGPDQRLFLPLARSSQLPALGNSGGARARDTQGTNFWVALPYNAPQFVFPNYIFARQSFWITADTAATGTITIAAIGYTTNFTVSAGGSVSVEIPNGGQLFPRGIVENGGIRIVSTADVSVMAFSNSEFISDTFLCLPVDALGMDHLIMSFPGTTIDGGGSEFALVATENATTVWITPKGSYTTYSAGGVGVNGGTPITRQAGVPFSIVLNAGQTYHAYSDEFAPIDLTGTRITANHPIAVYAGHLIARVPTSLGGANWLMEQMPPIKSWGTRYVTMPLGARNNGDTFRFLAAYPATEIRLNGALVSTLGVGQFYEFRLDQPAEVVASAPVLAMQFSEGSNSDANGETDPFMMWLPAVDQFLADYTIAVPSSFWPAGSFPHNYAQIVVPTNATGTVLLDGAPVSSALFTNLAASGYAGAKLSVVPGAHRVQSAVPAGVWVYGYAQFDGYGHPAGAILGEGALVSGINLSPASQSLPAGSVSSALATVTDGDGAPLAGVRVDFQVTGSNPTNVIAYTDLAGQAVLAYPALNAGGDLVRATADGLIAIVRRVIINGANTTLSGIVTDDALPAPGTLQTQWTQVSGPATATLGATNTLTTLAFFQVPGTYVFRLRAEDTELSGQDEVTITVQTNQPPVVNAGADLVVATNTLVTLNGSVTDDSLPSSASPVLEWRKVAGPGAVVFGSPAAAVTTASFGAPGRYVLRLTASDADADASDEVVVEAGDVNHAPLVNPGPARIVFVPNFLTLTASVTDDSLPRGGVLNYTWQQLSGPGSVTFNGGTNSLSTVVSFSQPGTYVFRLTANDTELTGSGDITVLASKFYDSNPFDDDPLADAGPDQTITLPARAFLTGRVLYDDHIQGRFPLFVSWQKISGPGNVTFALGNNRLNAATFDTAGAYVLRFTVCGDFSCFTDDVTITVNAGSATPPVDPLNQAPVVNAGPDVTITFPATLAVSGTITDDGRPAGNPLAGFWEAVNPSNEVIFEDAASASTVAHFRGPGTFTLRFTGTDFAATASDTLVVTVLPATNQAPVVTAQVTQTGFPGSYYIHGAFTDDGLPLNGLPSFQWSKLSGPGSVIFADNAQLDTRASFGALGAYVLRLSVTDGSLTGVADLSITLVPNQAPVVDAGPDVNVVVGHALELHGVVTDDGLPANGHLTAEWVKLTGPGIVSLSPPGGVLLGTNATATATFSAIGSYTLQLVGFDDGIKVTDTVNVTVLPVTNLPPVVLAGPDQTITLPANASLTPDVTDDARPAGNPLISTWSVVSGPGPVTFTPATTTNAAPGQTYTAAFTTPGGYVLRLTTTDGDLSASDDLAVTVHANAYNEPAPVAEITAPGDASEITQPTSIVGTANSTILQSYELQYRLTSSDDSGVWITFRTATTPVVNGVLGTFDPTLLLNGSYEIRLVVTDTQGRVITTPTLPSTVDRDMKVGHFALSFQDLSLPVSGIPIEIIRSYDSRDKRVGDFGVGWTLAIKNIRLQKNRHLGRNWDIASTGGLLPNWFVNSVKDRFVTVTFPSGKVYKFKARTEPESQFGFPQFYPRMVYTNQPGTSGTQGTLESLSGDELAAVGTVPGLIDFYDLNTFDLYNPTLFRLTTQEGDQYVIDEFEGLQSYTDRNGNTLTVTAGGILHSSGKSITFTRDGQGRITAITDPAGATMRYRYDGNGDLLEFVDRENQTNSYTYAVNHLLQDLVDPRGVRPLRNEYDDDGRLQRQIDGNGQAVNFTHDLGNRMEIIRDRLNHITIHEYDSRGNVLRLTDALGNQTTSTYDANDNELTKTDALGFTTTWTYDNLDNKLTETDSLGYVARWTYDALRNITSQTDARGFTLTNRYDEIGNLTNSVDALGRSTSYAYSGRGDLTSIIDPLGNATESQYDEGGHVIRMERRDFRLGTLNVTTYAYDANGNQTNKTTTRTAASGVETLVTSHVFDRENRLTLTIQPDGSTSQTVYNGIDKPALTVDALTRQTLFEYDSQGNLTNTVYPDLTATAQVFDAENRLIATRDQLGRVTGYAYDALGRLTNGLFANNSSTNAAYDAVGRLIAATDARGNATRLGYDAQCGCGQRKTSETNALGQVTFYAYDQNANLTNMVDALGRATTYVYDEANRRTQTIFHDGTSQVVQYDALDRKVAETDQGGKVTWFAHDALGRLTAVTNALGHITRYGYDEAGGLVTQTDAENRVTRYEYDRQGRRTKRMLPLGQSETFSYDATGNVTNRVDFNGKTTRYTYDLLNRLLSKIPDAGFGAPPVVYAYTPTGQRSTMSDASGTTAYAYNERDWLTNKVVTLVLPGGGSYASAIRYSYDAQGNLTNIASSNPNGTASVYVFDSLNRLQEVNDVQTGRTAYNYDAVGNLESYTYPNGVTTFRQFDSLNRLTNLVASHLALPVASYGYTVGAVGNRLTAAETVHRSGGPATINRVYTYDDTYRLTNEQIISGSVATLAYQYDQVGNRLSRNSTLPAIASSANTFDSNDLLNTDTHDANGNTLTGTSATAPLTSFYDFEDRIISATTPGRSVSIRYDGDGNRALKTVTTTTNSATTLFLVDDRNPTGYAQVMEELTVIEGLPAVTRLYVYGLDLIVQDRLDGLGWTASFFGCDGHGNARYLTDSLGQVTDTYDYDAFGNLIDRIGNTPNVYLYCGEQFDPELGLYYQRARYLNTDKGRFWTRDAFLGDAMRPVSMHGYQFADNSPVDSTDPTGFMTLTEVQQALGNLAQVGKSVFRQIFRKKGPKIADVYAVAGWSGVFYKKVEVPHIFLFVKPIASDSGLSYDVGPVNPNSVVAAGLGALFSAVPGHLTISTKSFAALKGIKTKVTSFDASQWVFFSALATGIPTSCDLPTTGSRSRPYRFIPGSNCGTWTAKATVLAVFVARIF